MSAADSLPTVGNDLDTWHLESGGKPVMPSSSLPQRLVSVASFGLVEPGWPAFWTVVSLHTVACTFVSLMFTDLGAAYFNGGTNPCFGEAQGTPNCNAALSTLSRTSMMFGMMSALLCTISGPLVGSMADVFGMKTVMLTSLTLRMSQFFAFFGLASGNMSIYPYFVTQEFSALADCGLSFNLWLLENTPPAFRVITFARLSAVHGLEGVLVPIVVMWSPQRIGPFVVLLLGFGCIFAAYFGMPQRKVSPSVRLAVEHKGLVSVCRQNLTQAWKFLAAEGNRLPILCVTLGKTVSFGLGGIWYLFLQARFGLGMHELAHYSAIAGLSTVLVQAVLVPLLQPVLGLRNLILFGLSFGILSMLVYVFLASTTWLLVAILLGAVSSVNGPAVSAMLANLATLCSGDTAGNSAQASVNSVNAIACLISPLLFQGIFSHFVQPDNVLFEGAWPGAPFALGLLLSTVLVVLIQVTPDSIFDKAEAQGNGDESKHLIS